MFFKRLTKSKSAPSVDTDARSDKATATDAKLPSLSAAELRRLQRHVVATVDDFVRNGGSHTGVLLPHRVDGGRCPRDGTPLVRRTIGGRTTWSCPGHQR
jgi:formamidopyrimidine-DNA glycosylase